MLVAGIEPAILIGALGAGPACWSLITNKNDSSPHSNEEGHSPACDLGAQLPFLLAIRFVDHPAHKAAHQTPQGYAPKLSESASESSGVPLVARLRRWLMNAATCTRCHRASSRRHYKAVSMADETWLDSPVVCKSNVANTKPLRWLMKLKQHEDKNE